MYQLLTFLQIVKCLVLKRMKQLEQSLIGGAVADSVLNGKLAELHRENKELRDKTRKLQDKLDVLIQFQKGVCNIHCYISIECNAICGPQRSIFYHLMFPSAS